jgi:type IV pilus assembly protein PilM
VTKLITTVYISDTVMRMMTTDGKQISEWSELQFEPGLIENNVILKEEAVAEKIKQFVEMKSINTRRVVLGISGIRCLTRPILLPKLPREILDEAVRREAVRLLPVPLDELYLSWQTIPAPEGKTHVFLTAIPRRTVDPLMKVLDKTGLKPVFMDLKPLLLARVAREETSILVDVQQTDFDVVIMVKGIPQPIRTIPFPGENPSWQNKLSIIREELDRTITFYNTNNPDKPVNTDIPVSVSGCLDDETEFRRLLSEEVKREVKMLPAPIESPEGFNSSHYMANIGLMLQETASGKNIGPSVVNLNTLPVNYKPQPVSSLNILKMLGIAFAFIFVAGMVLFIQNISSSITTKQVSLDSSRALLQQNQTEVIGLSDSVRSLNTQIQSLETAQQNLSAALATIELHSRGLNRDIQVMMDSLPGSVTLTSFSYENGVLTISGIAPSEKTVLTFYSSLNGSGRFSDIEIQEMSIRDDESMAFTLRGSLLISSTWVSSMGVILGNLPSTITLEFAATSEGALTLTGNSPDEEKLMAYLEKLDESGKFSEIAITDIMRTEDNSLDFIVVLRIGE